MPDVLRVVHYLNAFFGGLGGEEEAHTPVRVQPGALGPGRLLEQALAQQGQLVATIMCGDGYFVEIRRLVEPPDAPSSNAHDVVYSGRCL